MQKKRNRESSEWREAKTLECPSDEDIYEDKLLNQFRCLKNLRSKFFRINEDYLDVNVQSITFKMQQIYYYLHERYFRYGVHFILRQVMYDEVFICPYMIRQLRNDPKHTVVDL